MIYLPKELWIIIFKHLKTRSLIRFSIANKTTKNIFSDCLPWLTIDCRKSSINDRGLRHLKGVCTINLSGCKQITDLGLSYLKGIHTLDLKGCKQITDKGLSYLKGVHTIDLSECNQITIKGIQCLNPEFIGMRFLRTITSQ